MQILGKIAGKFVGKIAPKLGFFLGLIFAYKAGDSLTNLGATFSRSSVAYQQDISGTWNQVAANVPRDSHYINGVRRLLLEGSRTNSFLNSGVPASHTSPSLGTGTYTLWLQGSGSVAVAAGTATITGAATATAAAPKTFTVTVAGTVTFTVTGSVTLAQCENGASPSSYIATTAAAVTRAVDNLSLPFVWNPAEMTLYAKLVALGTGFTGGELPVVFIGTNGSSPSWEVYFTSGQLNSGFSTATATTSSNTIVYGDTVEALSTVTTDGHTTAGASVNGGALNSATSASAATMPGAFSGQTLTINGRGPAVIGFGAFESIKIALGTWTLASMQVAS